MRTLSGAPTSTIASFAWHDELNVSLLDRERAGRLEEILWGDRRYARRVDPASWVARGLGNRLVELLAMPLALLF